MNYVEDPMYHLDEWFRYLKIRHKAVNDTNVWLEHLLILKQINAPLDHIVDTQTKIDAFQKIDDAARACQLELFNEMTPEDQEEILIIKLSVGGAL